MSDIKTDADHGALGTLLREWREARRLSQLKLALIMDVSARHLSYVETGKARPSRQFVAQLGEALEMPLRERNALMLAAGYAPPYRERGLDAPEMTLIRRAIDVTLAQQEPFPAFVTNRHWDVVEANAAATRLFEALRPGGPKHGNILLQLFDPEDMRPHLANWEEVASEVLGHLHQEVARAPSDTRARALLGQVLRFPDIPAPWRKRDVNAVPPPIMTTRFRTPRGEIAFYSTLTTFVSSRDVTAEELRIESMHPADEPTRAFCRALA